MHIAHLVLISLLTFAGPSPEDLVTRLGSPRFSEREQAASTLRDLGRDALTALRAARQADDLEVRTRVRALIEEIETNLMVQPTRVRLNFQDQPIADVAHALGEQANVTINLVENNLVALRNTRVSLVESEPVPFWKALEELCQAGHLQINQGVQIVGVGATNRQPVLNLIPSALPTPPSATSGPFRVAVTSLVDHKERNFTPTTPIAIHAPIAIRNGVIVHRRVNPNANAKHNDSRPGVTSENFSMSLLVMAEPRMSIAIDGAVKVIEALDDLGNSLALPDAAGPIQHNSGYNGMAHVNGSTNLVLPVPLKMPEKPGRSIERFKATIPVVVMARKDDPLVVPLDAANRDRTFKNENITLTIHDVTQEPGQPFINIDLSFHFLQPIADGPHGGAISQEFLTFRQNHANSQNQIEILDDQGRPYHQWFPFQPHPSDDGTRMSVRLMPADGVGPPAQIRFYDLSRTATEIDIELSEIPLF